MDRLKTAFWLATLFFVIGTIFLILQLCFTDMFEITLLGYYYVYFSVIVNIIAVVLLLIVLIFKSDKIKTVKAIGVLLINIPIAYLYFLIVIKLID
ncbi:hypothetical protein WNY78_09890 [Psychroserpens sp. AS72]|uniref:hypothetical protein n=1 Tax=Psychroserpens sp. AS72 TaxID=3135775 RepID=UPI00316C32DB